MKITGAIFDLDGTLIDSMSMWNDFTESFLRDFGIEPDPTIEETVEAATVPGSIAFFRKHYLPDYSYEELERHIDNKVLSAYSETIPAKHGLKPFLFALRNKGVRMCVATSSPRRYAEAALKRLNLSHYFCCVLSCEDLNTTKATSDIYDRAFDILGTAKETTYIFEDALYAIKTAKSADYKVVAIKDTMNEADTDEIRRLADVYIKDYDDFRGMV